MSKLLDIVDSPQDLKNLPVDKLPDLAREIRDMLLDTISKTGGHLSSNLGVVELTMAMHYVFNSPKDKFVWDVGHQSYVHKLLTGRKDRFGTLRQYDGLWDLHDEKKVSTTTGIVGMGAHLFLRP